MRIRKEISGYTDGSFNFYNLLGWETEEDHYELMKTEKYAEFRKALSEYLDMSKGVDIYHMKLKKVYEAK